MAKKAKENSKRNIPFRRRDHTELIKLNNFYAPAMI